MPGDKESLTDLSSYGKELIKRYQAFRHADTNLRELILRVEDHWIKFEYQIKFLQGVWNDLDERLQVHQHHILQLLQRKLQQANDLLDSAIGDQIQSPAIESVIKKKGGIHRAKYALSLENCIERSVDDLEKWHAIFDPSWFLIVRVSSRNVDNQLNNESSKDNKSVWILKELREAIKNAAAHLEFVSGERTSFWRAPDTLMDQRNNIPFSNIQITQSRTDNRCFLVNTIVPDDMANLSTTARDIRDFGRILSKSEPWVFGLLRCDGIIKVEGSPENKRTAKFELLFSVPNGLQDPKALRTLLRAKEGSYSLNERLNLARSLASSVMYIHSSNFVHKNIRPETTIVFSDEDSELAAPFLLGFEKFRSVARVTFKRGDSSWEKDLYRHPSRQGLHPEEDYIMQHDIYSLGVLLLEIGIWTSFIEHDEKGNPVPGSMLDIGEFVQERNERKKAASIKAAFINMAATQLPCKMGKKYASIVVACLTCLDKTNNGFGDEEEFEDEDGIVVGVRYIEKVLLRIHEISV